MINKRFLLPMYNISFATTICLINLCVSPIYNRPPNVTKPDWSNTTAVLCGSFHNIAKYVYIFTNKNFFIYIMSESIQSLASTGKNKYIVEEPKPACYITNEYHEKFIDRGKKQGDAVANRN